MFWKIMKPKSGGDPGGPIAEAIQKSFGSFRTFKPNQRCWRQAVRQRLGMAGWQAQR